MRFPAQSWSALRVASALLLLGVVAAPSWAAEKPLFTLGDPVGDDHGDGSLVYPLDGNPSSGELDLKSLSARRGSDGTWFEATFARPIHKTDRRAIDALGTSLDTVAKLGFYDFNLDIYIDMDRVAGSGAILALPGRRAEIASANAWERAVVLTPQPFAAAGDLERLLMRQLKERMKNETAGLSREEAEQLRNAIPSDLASHVYFPNRVRVQGSKVSFFVPDSFLGGPAQAGWSYVVAVSGCDLIQRYDGKSRLKYDPDDEAGLMILPVAEGKWSDRFGGGREDDHLQPPLVDILVPTGATQERVLRDYDLDTGRAVRLPGVVPADAAKP